MLLHLGLSLAYGVVVPLSEAPDELSHYDYVRVVAREWRLPVGTEVGEAIQPPLYYILGAALTWPIPMDLDFARSNPAFRLHDPEAPKNLFVHGRAEAFPYRGSALAFHLVRVLSAVLSTLTVWAVYRGLLLLMQGDQVAALGGAGFLAFLPEFCYLGGAAQNDNLAALLAALLLWRLLALLRGREGWAVWTQVGVLLGLGLLSKVSLVAFVPLVGLVAAWRAWQARRGGLARGVMVEGVRLGWALALAAAIAGWWYARNVRLYGDPLGWALIRRAVDLQHCPWTWGGVWWMLRGLFESFWGRFGGAAHVRLPPWAYLLAVGLSAVALLGAARGLLAWWRAGCPGRREVAGWGLMLIWLGAVGTALVRYTLTAQGTNQARLLYPALLPLVGVLWTGLLRWFPRRKWPWVGAGVSGLLVLANLALLVWFLPAHYGLPGPVAPVETPLPAAPLAVFGGKIALLEARLEPQVVDAQGQVEVRLVWQALSDIQEDYRVSLWVQGPAGVPPWEVKSAPAGGRSPTDLWRASQVTWDHYTLPLPPDAPLGRYQVYLGVRRFLTDLWLEPDKPLPPGGPGHRIALGTFRYRPAIFPDLPTGVAHALRAEFGGQVALVGYAMREVLHPTRPEVQAVEVTLYWQALGAARGDLVFFAHLLDGEGRYVAGHDQVPYGGTFPSSRWPQGVVVLDRHRIPLTGACPGLVYQVEVGAYPAPFGPRLLVTGGEVPLGEDRVLLEPLRISPRAF